MTPVSIEIDVEIVNASGDGVGHHRGRPIAIPFTIPGERVRITTRRSHDGALVASLDEIVRPSPHRVVPRCPHFGPPSRPHAGGCGGCTWQHIAYAEQLRLKSGLVTRLVRGAVRDAPAARPTLAGTSTESPWGYRQKVHFVFGPERPDTADRRLAMGHYARGSRRVLPVVTCPVHDERGNQLAFRFRDALAQAGVIAGDAPKSLAVRVGVGSTEMMATLVLARDADRRIRAASRRAIDGSTASSFHVNLHPRGDAYIFGRETRRISGSDRLRQEVAGTSFLISPTAFFQTNVRAAAILVGLVVDALTVPPRVLDLYAGAGLFALPIAKAGSRVVAVEESRIAVADGEASRTLNGIPEQQCRFVARRVEAAIKPLRQPFDAVVLDPPRTGCTASVLNGVFGRLAPSRAIYVSCNPEALARDLASIASLGYRIASLQPVDMFPHTAHVETVVVLQRR